MRSPTRFSLPVLPFVLVALGNVPASGQSLLEFQGQVVAANGDVVPGGAGLFGNPLAFDLGVIDDSRKIFFRGHFTGGGATSLNDRAYFYGDSKGSLTLVLRSGDSEPSGTVPGATLNTNTGTGITGSVRISPTGLMLFGATLNDGGVNVTPANDTALYLGVPGNFQILVREGDPAAGTAGATYSSGFNAPSQQFTGVNAAGQVLFRSNLAGGDVSGTTNNEGWYTGTLGSLVLALRKGDLAPGGEQIAALSFAGVGQMNASGQILHDVSFVLGSGAVPVTAANDRALWIYTPGTGNQQVVREGDPTPIPGVTFSGPTANWTVNTGACTFNASGQSLIRSDLGGAVTAGVDDTAILRVSLAGHALVARRGDPAPGVPGATLDGFNDFSLQINDAGQVAFQSTLLGGGVTTTDDSGIWAGTPGSLVLVAREGAVAPGTGGSTFGSTPGQSMMMNGAGQLTFVNSLAGGGAPGSSLWSWDPAAGLQAVVLSGDTVEVQPGVPKTVGSSGGVQFNNGDSRPLSFADDGTIALRVNMTDGTAAIMHVRLGSLAGEPSTLSAAVGGTHNLYLNAGPARAGEVYIVAGSLSGTVPGTPFGAFLIPLNFDAYTNLMLSSPNAGIFGNTLGTLDADGRATATVTLPPGLAIPGLLVDHAFGTIDASSNLSFVSEPARLEILP